MKREWKAIVSLWLSWAILMLLYQAYVPARFDVHRPDRAVSWTEDETRKHSQDDKPYLMEPYLNTHVSWDSEYYLSIAVGGYHDPQMRAISPHFTWDHPRVALQSKQPDWLSMNYAFFPFYPFLIRLVMVPLRVLGKNPIATASLAGVLVSLLGTLGAMFALFDLAQEQLQRDGGLRATFYLLIFPAGMFLAQVYTEGLFLGLSFGALALAKRKQWVWAGVLSAGATWTRAGGALLLLPLLGYWWQSGAARQLGRQFSWRSLLEGLFVLSPLFAYLAWNAIFGAPFHLVESRFFSRGLLLLDQSRHAWQDAWQYMFDNPQATAYYSIEFLAIIFGILACVLTWRDDWLLSLYSLVVIFFALTSGSAQGMHRYVMAAPVIFLLPARWGRDQVFDRAWTLGNILLMGIYGAMFSFDFWAG